jgi:ATP-dependent protease ClpP protease subunit
MITRNEFLNYLKRNSDNEFSKEEIINIFSKTEEEENFIDKLLSELEVESTYNQTNLNVNCKGGTVYFKWNSS